MLGASLRDAQRLAAAWRARSTWPSFLLVHRTNSDSTRAWVQTPLSTTKNAARVGRACFHWARSMRAMRRSFSSSSGKAAALVQ